MKEAKVLLVKISLGRATARKHPLNQDQHTKLFSEEEKGEGHGFTVEMITAIKMYGRYHRVILLPDGSEIAGDVFFRANKYTELNDTEFVRQGLINFIAKINKDACTYMKALQKPQPQIERFFESFS